MLRFGMMSGCSSVAVGALLLAAGGPNAFGQSCQGQWLPGSPGFDRELWALSPYQGDLVAAGDFAAAPGIAAKNIARWNGAAWTGMNADTLFTPHALRVQGGVLYVGKSLSTPFSPPVGVAKWNGTSWVALPEALPGGGASTPQVLTLGEYQGMLLAAGNIRLTNGSPSNGVMLWDGAHWQNLGAVFSLGSVTTSAVYQGALYVAGPSLMFGSISQGAVFKYDGATWSKVGPFGLKASFGGVALRVYRDKLFISAPDVRNGGDASYGPLVSWDGTTVSREGTAASIQGAVTSMIEYHGDLVIGGAFTNAFGVGANGVVRWNGTNFAAFGQGIVGTSSTGRRVNCLDVYHDELIAGGDFDSAGGLALPHFARWSDQPLAWTAVQPKSQPINGGLNLKLSATPASGYSNVTYQWKRNGADVVNGAGGASAGGGVVSGALGALASPTDGSPVTLTIGGVQATDAGSFTVVFTTACGGSASAPAAVTVNACPSDLNGDDVVDSADFVIFVNAYDTLDCAAPEMPAWCPSDLNGDGVVDDADFSVFVLAYDAMVCP